MAQIGLDARADLDMDIDKDIHIIQEMWHQSLPAHFYRATSTDWEGAGEGRDEDPGENLKTNSAADVGQVAAEVGGEGGKGGERGEGEKTGGVDASDGLVLGQQGVDVCGCLWMSVDICVYLWMSGDVCGCMWMSVDVCGCLWMVDSCNAQSVFPPF